MNSLRVPLKKWAVCVLGLTAFAGQNVSAAAVDPYAPRCGYGHKACQQGYDCIKTTTYGSSCQKVDYLSSPTYEFKRSPPCSGPPCPPPPPGSTFTPVIGVPENIVERRPIAVLQNDHADAFNMLVLALESLQGRNESIDISIHGFPYVPWQYLPEATVNPGLGYCTHASAIFTTWHRPYLVLLEQLLHAEAVAIAKKFTGSTATKYQAAAEEVRIPYWDWASDDTQSRIPKVVSASSLAVIKPGSKGAGFSTVIPNPLYHYRFANPQPQSSGLGPITTRGADADNVLFSTFQGRKDATLRLFSDNDYNQFSRDAEGIHNAIHVDVGGDMVSVPTAAFDPIFWLHHCNVDRLVAMYQASHPGVSLTPAPRSPTFALGGNGPDDLFTPLYPFRHTSGKEWNSNDMETAESIFTTGYAYPEVPAGQTGDALRIFATQKANQLYGPNLKSASFVGSESGAQAPTARREWTANVLVDREELPGSHKVLIYIGKYDKKNPDSYGGDDNLVGVAGLFAGTASHSSNNQYLNISIPLTEALVAKNIALRPEDVVPTLTDQLHWTVEKVDPSTTNPIPITDLKSLKIAVSSTITEYFEDKTKLAVVSDPLTHYEPTAGKTGGLQPGEKAPVGNAAPPVSANGTVVASS